MSVVDQLRSAHEELIAENPATIEHTRVEKVREGGGFRNVESDLGPFTGRIYQDVGGRTSRTQGADVLIPGMQDVDVRWGCVAPLERDDGTAIEIKAGPNVQDTLTHPTVGAFRVRAVMPNMDLGEVWGWRAELEQVT